MKDRLDNYFESREEIERDLYETSLFIENISKEIKRLSNAFMITGNEIMGENLNLIYKDLKESSQRIQDLNNKKSRLENDKIKADFGETLSLVFNHAITKGESK